MDINIFLRQCILHLTVDPANWEFSPFTWNPCKRNIIPNQLLQSYPCREVIKDKMFETKRHPNSPLVMHKKTVLNETAHETEVVKNPLEFWEMLLVFYLGGKNLYFFSLFCIFCLPFYRFYCVDFLVSFVLHHPWVFTGSYTGDEPLLKQKVRLAWQQ